MSGTRLPGDDDSNDRHKSRERAETRLSGDLAARFSEFLDAHDASKSEVLRDALDEYLPATADSQYALPRDRDLRDAYLALAAEDEEIVMRVDKVLSILSSETHPTEPKELIEKTVLRPLGETPFLSVSFGRVAVHPLTLRGEIKEDGDRDE